MVLTKKQKTQHPAIVDFGVSPAPGARETLPKGGEAKSVAILAQGLLRTLSSVAISARGSRRFLPLGIGEPCLSHAPCFASCFQLPSIVHPDLIIVIVSSGMKGGQSSGSKHFAPDTDVHNMDVAEQAQVALISTQVPGSVANVVPLLQQQQEATNAMFDRTDAAIADLASRIQRIEEDP